MLLKVNTELNILLAFLLYNAKVSPISIKPLNILFFTNKSVNFDFVFNEVIRLEDRRTTDPISNIEDDVA